MIVTQPINEWLPAASSMRFGWENGLNKLLQEPWTGTVSCKPCISMNPNFIPPCLACQCSPTSTLISNDGSPSSCWMSTNQLGILCDVTQNFTNTRWLGNSHFVAVALSQQNDISWGFGWTNLPNIANSLPDCRQARFGSNYCSSLVQYFVCTIVKRLLICTQALFVIFIYLWNHNHYLSIHLFTDFVLVLHLCICFHFHIIYICTILAS